MPVDTFAKRMAVGGLGGPWLGPNVFPGTTSVTLGRAAAAWNYAPTAPTPPEGGTPIDPTTLGSLQELSITSSPTIGGGWGW